MECSDCLRLVKTLDTTDCKDGQISTHLRLESLAHLIKNKQDYNTDTVQEQKDCQDNH